MSALPNRPLLRPMTVSDVDRVVAVEKQAYEFPWSRGNFVDSLAAGYVTRVLQLHAGVLAGYYIAMPGVDEMHLLNITVAPEAQRQGHALLMLDELVGVSRSRGALQLWLEVRQSNHRARDIYERYGFRLVGVRRGYYPAPRSTREDAAVMSLQLTNATPGGKGHHGIH